MSYNIGPKIGIDGEKEFRNSIKQINDTYKALDAETRALTAAFDAQGDEQGKLEATSKQLQKQLDLQKQKMGLLEDAVKKASEKYGENSIEATRLRGALYDTQATVSKLETELEDTSSALNGTGDAMEDFAEEAEDASDAALSFGDVLKANIASDLVLDTIKDIGSAIKDFATEAIDAAADIKASTSKFKQSFGEMEDEAKDALESVADEAGITATRLQDSFTSIYAFNKSVGADAEAALDIASRALRAAADSAAYYDKSVEDATETLQSFLKGNYENDAALGISATETTRNTMANQMYAKSFNELSESQRIDVLLAMVEAGNAASGALGQAAREADSWTNVNGELSESWRQFLGVIGDPIMAAATPVIQGITGALKALTSILSETSDAEKLASSMDDFVESMEAANETFEKAEAEISAASAEAEYYVRRLEELENAGLDTAEAQREYQAVIEKLNELVPDLNLTIDEQTGLLKENLNVIKADIQAWKNNATAKALQEKFKDVLEAQGEATAELVTAQASLNALELERSYLLEREAAASSAYEAAERALIAAQAEYEALVVSGNANVQETLDLIDELTRKRGQAQATLVELETPINDNRAAIEDLREEIVDAEETVASYSDQISLAAESVAVFNKSADSATTTTSSFTEAVNKISEDLQLLSQAHETVKGAALDSINTQIGLFDELVLSNEYSAEKIIENWASQQAAFNNYSANLQKAIDLGLDQVLVSQLSDGSAESMMILDALVSDTEIGVADINTAFAGLSDSKDSLADAIAHIRVAADPEYAALAADATEAGVYTVDGLIEGVLSREDEFEDAMRKLAKKGMSGYNGEMAINSPAKKMIPSGEYTVEGAIVGVDNMAGAFEDAMSGLAVAGADAFLGKQLDRVWEYPSVVQNPVRYSRSVSHSYGGQTFQIYQQPGESNEDLAYRIMEIMQQEVEVKETGFGV